MVIVVRGSGFRDMEKLLNSTIGLFQTGGKNNTLRIIPVSKWLWLVDPVDPLSRATFPFQSA